MFAEAVFAEAAPQPTVFLPPSELGDMGGVKNLDLGAILSRMHLRPFLERTQNLGSNGPRPASPGYQRNT